MNVSNVHTSGDNLPLLLDTGLLSFDLVKKLVKEFHTRYISMMCVKGRSC